MQLAAFLLILAGGVVTFAGLAATVRTVQLVNAARRSRRSLFDDPGWASRKLPMNAGAPHLDKPDLANWTTEDVRGYVDHRLHALDVMLSAEMREGLEPLLETGLAAAGAVMLAVGVLAQTAGGLLSLFL